MQPILIPAHHAACELMQRPCQPEVAERTPEYTTPAISCPKTGRAVGCALDRGASEAGHYRRSRLQFHEPAASARAANPRPSGIALAVPGRLLRAVAHRHVGAEEGLELTQHRDPCR